MDGRRILSETQRNILRPATLRLLVAIVALMSLTAWLGQSEQGLELPLHLTYYLFPLFFCPYTAHRALADRDDGANTGLATTPLTQAEGLSAKILHTLLTPLLAAVATLPILYALAPTWVPGAFPAMLEHVAWFLAVAWAAGSIGLLVGHLTPNHPRLGLGLAFGLIPLWFVTGTTLNDAQDPSLLLELLAKLSPFTYQDSMWLITPVPTGPPSMLVGPLLLAATALGVLVPLAIGLQGAKGFDRPLRYHPFALGGLALILVAGTGTVAAWELPEDSTPSYAFPLEDGQAGLGWSIFPDLSEGLFAPWTPQTPVEVRVQVFGPPNATVHLEQLQLSSPSVNFELSAPSSKTLVLDRVFTDTEGRWAEPDTRVGTNDTILTFTGHPDELFAYTPAELTFRADGEPVQFPLSFLGSDWQMNQPRITGLTLASLLPLAAAARWLPGRWNRW